MDTPAPNALLRNDFVARLNQDLRTPLTTIVGYSQLMERDKTGSLSPKQKKYLETIQASGHDMLALINALVEWARLEAGQTPALPVPVELPALLQEAVSSEQALAAKKAIEIEVKNRVRPDVEVQLDPRMMRGILSRLLNNALKFSGLSSKIRLSVKMDGEGLRFSVRDHGVGVRPERQEVLFLLWSTACAPSSAGGLGLCLVQRLAQAQDGRVWMESSGVEGEGSVFHVWLPRVPRARGCSEDSASNGPERTDHAQH